MPRIKDLSPKLSGIKTAEAELALPPTVGMGERVGGLQMFSNALKRGFGDNVFGADDNGIWLGAAEFADAPFSVDMAGNAVLNSVAVGNYLTKAGANQAVSGQIIVGGSVDGSLLVKDASNNTRVTLDQDGITITDGALTIKDETNTTIIDSQGIVSAVTFLNDYYFDDTNVSTTSSTFADVSGSSLTFTLARETNVLVAFYALVETMGTNANTAYRTDVQMVIDGSGISPIGSSGWQATTALTFMKKDSISCARIVTLAAGEHTIKLQWRCTGATGAESNLLTRNLNYIILGK